MKLRHTTLALALLASLTSNVLANTLDEPAVLDEGIPAQNIPAEPAVLTEGIPAPNNTATIHVEGTVVPGACHVNLNGGQSTSHVMKYESLNITDLDNTKDSKGFSPLATRTVPLVVKCSGQTSQGFKIQISDNLKRTGLNKDNEFELRSGNQNAGYYQLKINNIQFSLNGTSTASSNTINAFLRNNAWQNITNSEENMMDGMSANIVVQPYLLVEKISKNQTYAFNGESTVSVNYM